MALSDQYIRDIAHVCHEANRALQVTNKNYNGDISPHFSEAPEWMVDSAKECVKEVLEGSTPEQLHESWMAHKISEGWVYGETRDATLKTHPCLVEYSQLSGSERVRYVLFVGIVKVFAEFE